MTSTTKLACLAVAVLGLEAAECSTSVAPAISSRTLRGGVAVEMGWKRDEALRGGRPEPMLRLKGGGGNEWKECVDASSGKKYYYNRESKATAWKLPEGATLIGAGSVTATPSRQSGGAEASGAGGDPAADGNPSKAAATWKQAVDAASGKTVRVLRDQALLPLPLAIWKKCWAPRVHPSPRPFVTVSHHINHPPPTSPTPPFKHSNILTESKTGILLSSRPSGHACSRGAHQ